MSDKAQRQGLGRQLLDFMEMYGSEYGMKRIMLTCLKGWAISHIESFLMTRYISENAAALSFYSKRGYVRYIPLAVPSYINDRYTNDSICPSNWTQSDDEDDDDDEEDEESETVDYFILSKALEKQEGHPA